MSTTETASLPYAKVGPPVYMNKWNEQLQTTQSGFQQRVRWLANGAIFPVFIPDGADFAATLDALARYQGEQFDTSDAKGQ